MFTLTTRTTGKIRLRRVAFSPDGSRLDTCGDRGEARAWDVAARRCITAPPLHWPLANVFIGGDELFVLNQYAKSLTAHHLETNYSRLLGHADLLAPSPDGQRVFCCLDESARTLSAHSLTDFASPWTTPFAEVTSELVLAPTSLCCSADGKRLACGHYSGRVSVLDAGTGAWLHRLGDAGTPSVKAIAISPRGEALAWCASSNLHFRRLRDDFRVHHRIGKTHFHAVAWHPSGAFFATTNGDGSVDYWNGLTGQRRESFDWHLGKLNDIAFDPAGDRAAACSDAGLVVVWDVD